MSISALHIPTNRKDYTGNDQLGVEKWKALNQTDLHAYFGVLLLAGGYRSKGEATASLRSEENGRPIFRATMTLETFHMISRVIRFDNRDTRAG